MRGSSIAAQAVQVFTSPVAQGLVLDHGCHYYPCHGPSLADRLRLNLTYSDDLQPVHPISLNIRVQYTCTPSAD